MGLFDFCINKRFNKIFKKLGKYKSLKSQKLLAKIQKLTLILITLCL